MQRLRRLFLGLTWIAASLAFAAPVRADGILDLLRPSRHKLKKQEPYKPHLGHHNTPPMTMVQLANVIDIIEQDLRQDGTVVIQQPSVWGQARMTLYRRNFEKEMADGLDDFKFILSARVARSDQASFQSQTALAASLSPGPKEGPIVLTQKEILSERGELAKAAADILAKSTDKLEAVQAFKLLERVFSKVGTGDGNLGLEPTVFLDEKKRYLDHLNQIRRINLGDDSADSAGYGLYLVRMPVSIEPGSRTDHGHGAMMTVTAEHDFQPLFLQRTFRNLVINDLVDQLTPILFEIREHEIDAKIVAIYDKLAAVNKPIADDISKIEKESAGIREDGDKGRLLTGIKGPGLERFQNRLFSEKVFNGCEYNNLLAKFANDPVRTALTEEYKKLIEELAKETKTPIPATIVNGKSYPVAPTDKLNVFIPGYHESPHDLPGGTFIRFLKRVRDSQHTKRPRSIDIRNFLQHELEAAYDIMERGLGGPVPLGEIPLIESITRNFRTRRFTKNLGSLQDDFTSLMNLLQGKVQDSSFGFLCWTIAVDAALLNERLREDIQRVSGRGGFPCPQELGQLHFHLPPALAGTEVNLAAAQVFEEYVRNRWPLMTFSLDPTVDQQNIADANSVRRDLDLAVAFAFASGRINFTQMQRFHRILAVDAETIALNRTVTCFSFRNDTFGWKFTPRFQHAPPPSNPRLLASMLAFGGQHPNYQENKSKLERGQRELTAVIVMPSFLNSIRLDVRGNWFKLTHPVNQTISSARMLEQGRYVKELLESDSAMVCDLHRYREQDIRSLHMKLRQLEKMLPIQNYTVNVPYENTLGGFDLFVPGTTALVPIVVGYDGIDLMNSVAPKVDTVDHSAFFLYGKHFSIHETKVVAGGRLVADDDVEILSREVMRVKVPKDVQATAIKEGDGSRPFMEIHVATPNGISNRVLIPMPDPGEKADDSPKAVATDPILALTTKKAIIQACWVPGKEEAKKEEAKKEEAKKEEAKKDKTCLCNLLFVNTDTDFVKFKWNRAKIQAPEKVSLLFNFQIQGKEPVVFVLPAKVGADAVYAVAMKEIGTKVLEKLAGPGYFKAGDPVPDALSGSVTVLNAGDQAIYDASAIVADRLALRLEILNPAGCKK